MQTSATARPIYDAWGLNGKPVVRFDGTDDWMALSSLYLDGDITVFFLTENVTQTTGGSYHRGLLAADNDPYRLDGDGYGFGYGRKNADRFRISIGNGASEQAVQNMPPATEEFEVIAYSHDLGWGELHRNGVLVASAAQTRSSDFHTGYELGTQYIGDRYYVGAIAEVIVYDRALSASEIASVEMYLTEKWGIVF
jgi:hypothetical protein